MYELTYTVNDWDRNSDEIIQVFDWLEQINNLIEETMWQICMVRIIQLESY